MAKAIITRRDDWDGMVPESIRKQFPSLTETLDFLNEHLASREAALSVFWMIHDLLKKQLPPSQEILDKLDNLERKLNGELQAYDKEASNIFVYLHVAGSFIITLERKQTTWSERFTETLEEIERLWDYGVYRKFWDFSEGDPYGKSLCSVLGNMCIRLFVLRDNEGKWQEALSNVVFAIRPAEILGAWADLDDLNPQAPVDTFEKLWDNPNKVESWQELAEFCGEVCYSDEYLEAEVKWKGEETDWLRFWTYAEGLCRSRLSPTEYNKQRDRDEEQESERRLRNYFFYDCWDSISEPLRDDLKSIDHLWFSQEKMNLGSILENLKIVTEQLLRRILWDPFIQWRSSSHIKTDIKALNNEINFTKRLQKLRDRNHEPTLPDFAAMLELASFKEFISQRLISQDNREFVLNNLSEPLRELNRKRTSRAHPKTPQTWQREDIALLLKKFFGIDCQGILPFLARMLKEDTKGRGKS